MQFEWDQEKRDKTLKERGIDFTDAARIWLDPDRQERIDIRHAYGEARMQTIGMVENSILFVVYTERIRQNGEDVIRIISARRAKESERAEYHAKTFYRGLVS